MNDAHLHMVVNHFPIIGTILGLGILIAGLLLTNKSVQHTAYVLFAIAAIFGLLSMNTGEGAEEMVEDLPNVGKQIIHEHEEIAEKFVILLYLTGAVALLSLFMSFKNHVKAKFFAYATLILAIGTAVLSKNVGTSGGEIRHTEIRENASNNGASSQTNGTETTDDEH